MAIISRRGHNLEILSGIQPARTRPGDESPAYAEALASELRRTVEGEVRFDSGSRALYATDASNYRQAPIGVVIPRHTEDVVNTMALCRSYGAPVLSRGGGTSLAGQTCNVAVVLDFSKYMNRILHLDPASKRARVEPGVVLDVLRAAAEKHHLTFGPDPATHKYCTLGGMIGNNSCGVHSIMGGNTVDNVEELEILTHDGLRMRVGPTSDEDFERIAGAGGRAAEIYRKLRDLRDHYSRELRSQYPRIPRRVSGYNLSDLLPEQGFHVARALTGSEGTCVTVLQATVRLVESPPVRSLLVLGYPNIFEAGDHISRILEFQPIGLEGVDDVLVDSMKKKGLHPGNIDLLPDGEGWLLVEFGGADVGESEGKARAAMEALQAQPDRPSMRLYQDPAEAKLIWEIRESGLGATAFVPGEDDAWPGWEDSAVPPERVGDYLRDLRGLYRKYNYHGALYGHFGQGCIHSRISFDLTTAAGIARYRSFMEEAADLVLNYGGSLSGEHGDGQARGELLAKMFGPRLMQAFREFKSIWDPEWKMNPGKVIDADPMDAHLRLGADYNPPDPATHFHFPEDQSSFSRAALRCVGVGRCRSLEGETMCPSYRATLEEKHTTRGRARMLFEMLQGEVLRDGWKSDEVHDSLDLCLSCKGCKSDCPVNVDMAAYKAEFLSHYYEGRVRPRTAYALGLIDQWARLASYIPRTANFVTQTPGLRLLAKKAAGISPHRDLPKFASESFQRWFKRRGVRNSGAPRVVLFPDTFNNYFHPQIAAAAVDVLEHAGFRVTAPEEKVCCGRPLYDFGMLRRAKGLLNGVIKTLGEEIESGVPVVMLEPSCAAVFRDEMTELLPHSQDAKRLRQQTYTLAEFLAANTGFAPPKLRRKAIVHGHCHQKAVLKMESNREVLANLGLDFTMLDSGCCGMAGSFGFEEHKYDVSMKIGDLVLLPAVRGAPKDTLVIADGFSCAAQIEQGTDRKALHLAQVLQAAVRQDDLRLPERYPERAFEPAGIWKRAARVLREAAIAAAAGAAGASLVWLIRQKRAARQPAPESRGRRPVRELV